VTGSSTVKISNHGRTLKRRFTNLRVFSQNRIYPFFFTVNWIPYLEPLSEFDQFFNEAVSFIGSGKNRITQKNQLKFYAFYKVAAVGPCNLSAPSMLDFKERAKWDSWMKYSNLSKAEAQREYIKLVSEIKPNWRERSFQDLQKMQQRADADEERDEYGLTQSEREELEEEKGQPSENRQFGTVFSSLASNQHDLNVKEDLFYYCQEGNLEKVKELLTQENINQLQEGESPLHWAVDRHHLGIVNYLITSGAAIDIKNADGYTPLHNAIICENAEIITVLMRHGANPRFISEYLDDEDANPLKGAPEQIRQLVIDLLKERGETLSDNDEFEEIEKI